MNGVRDRAGETGEVADLRRRALRLLSADRQIAHGDGHGRISRGDDDLNPGLAEELADMRAPSPAGVLVPIVERSGGATILLTRRADHLASHGGQIAFPGGKVEADDDHVFDAILRETREETAIRADQIEFIGFLDCYRTSSGFCVYPAVAILSPDIAPVADPGEVAEIFEVPLSFLMNPANHHKRSIFWRGKKRKFYAMAYGEYYIWGATAGMLRNLYERLFAP